MDEKRRGISPLRQIPSIPRKGTETIRCPWPRLLCPICQIPSIPRKGTETRERIQHQQQSVVGCQIPSIPRKGTETSNPAAFSLFSMLVRYPQFPARGRKLVVVKNVAGIKLYKCQIPSIPRKGTET